MKKKVLIVEDSKVYTQFLTATLNNAGFEVIAADNIYISRLVIEHQPDLVLMDVEIGQASGITAVKAIRNRSFGTGITFVLHSSKSADELDTLCRQCGAQGYISKDGNPATLINAINSFLHSPEKTAKSLAG